MRAKKKKGSFSEVQVSVILIHVYADENIYNFLA